MLSEELKLKKELKLINTKAITRQNAIAIYRDQQSWRSSFSFIQACLQFFNKSQRRNSLKSNYKYTTIELPKSGVNLN